MAGSLEFFSTENRRIFDNLQLRQSPTSTISNSGNLSEFSANPIHEDSRISHIIGRKYTLKGTRTDYRIV